MSTDYSPAPTGSRPIRPQLILTVCCMSVALTGINLSSVNVALPSIGRDLGASVESLQWMITANSLAMACLLLLAGSIADRFGRKRIFQLGLILFTLGSLLSGFAPNVGWLIAFRALQGIGGSMLNPVALSIVVGVFTDRRERAKAIGVWGSVIGITIAVGPVLGGLLVSGLGWRSVFWVNVPIGIVAILLTQRFIRESKAARPRAFDLPGQGLIIVLFAAIIAATIEGPRLGWTDPWIIGLVAVAVLAIVGILVVEPRRLDPVVDLRFFRSPPFAGANAISVVMSAALGGFLFLNTLYLQDIRNISPLLAGVMIIPLAVGQAVAANLSGRLLASRGARLPLVLGGLLLAVGGFLLVALSTQTTVGYLLTAYALFGLGVGAISPTITNIAVSGMPADQVGVAGALAASARQFGTSIGVAVTGALVATTGPAFVDSSHAAWVVLGGCGIAVVAIGLLSTGRRAEAAAARNGERLTVEP